MTGKLEQLRGGVAAVASMTGIGWPRIAFAPNDDNGGGDGGEGGEGGNNGGGDDKSGDKGGDNSGDDGSNKTPSKLANAGLLGRRPGANGDASKKDGENGSDAPTDGRPAGLPEKFWDGEKKSPKVDDLAKAYIDLEKAHGTLKRSKSVGGEVPENADDYFKDPIKLPDTVTNLALPADDPGLKVAAGVFQKYGIGKDAAVGIIKDIFAGMNDHVPAPIDPDAEMAALGKGGEALLDGVFTWADGRITSGQFSEDDAGIIADLSATAAGIKFLAKVREMSGEQRIPIDPGTGARGMSFEQHREAYKDAVKKGDYKEQERLDALAEKMWPDQPLNLSGGYTSEKTIAR